jgi:hypothetical protein
MNRSYALIGLVLLAAPAAAAASSAAEMPALARQDAVHDLAAARRELARPVRAEMDVENAETALANGAEAANEAPTPAATPFRQQVAARRAVLHDRSRVEKLRSLDKAVAAAKAAR